MSSFEDDVTDFLSAIDSLAERLEPPRRPQDAGFQECSPREIRVLQALRHGPLTMSKLVAILKVPHSTVTRTVDKLEAKELVERRQSSEDRRIVEADFTAMGRQINRYIDKTRRAQAKSMMEAMTDSQRKRFLRQINQLLAE